jgi:hypothetical protein
LAFPLTFTQLAASTCPVVALVKTEGNEDGSRIELFRVFGVIRRLIPLSRCGQVWPAFHSALRVPNSGLKCPQPSPSSLCVKVSFFLPTKSDKSRQNQQFTTKTPKTNNINGLRQNPPKPALSRASVVSRFLAFIARPTFGFPLFSGCQRPGFASSCRAVAQRRRKRSATCPLSPMSAISSNLFCPSPVAVRVSAVADW